MSITPSRQSLGVPLDRMSTKEGNKTRKPVTDGIKSKRKKRKNKKLSIPNTKIWREKLQNKLNWMKKFDKRRTIFHLCYLPLVACTKDRLLGFILNNHSSFVNSSLHQILCGNGVYICKIKKNKVPCHAVAVSY